MASSNTFPVFIRAEYDGSGSAFAKFESEAAQSVGRAKRLFDDAGQSIKSVLDKALSGPRTDLGSLDLGVSELRRAAAAADERAQAAAMMATAIQRAAQAEGDYSVKARASSAAAEALAVEYRQAAAAARDQVSATEQVQRQLDALTRSQGAVSRGHLTLIEGGRGVVRSAGEQRTAMIQIGQQMQDVAVSFAGGQQASTIFAQQLPQLAFAMSGLSGVAGRVGTFFAGPWGVSLSLGALALGPLINNLFQSANAASEAEEASKALAERQLDIANFFDIATGAIKEQNTALIQNARLKRLEEIDAERKTIKQRADDIRNLVLGSDDSRFVGGGGIAPGASVAPTELPGNPDLVNALAAARGNQAIIDAELARLAQSTSGNAARAREILELRAKQALAVREVQRLSLETESLEAGRLAPGLRKPPATRKTRARKGGDGEAAARALDVVRERGEDASQRIENLVAQFDRTPPAVARVSKALGVLDDLANDFSKKQPPNYADLVKQLDEARKVITNFPATILSESLKEGEQQLEIQSLIAQGREDEAEALTRLIALQKESGQVAADAPRLILEQVQAMRALGKQQEVLRAQIEPYLRAIDGIEGSLNAAFAGLRTDAPGAIKGLFSSIGSTIDQAFADYLSETLLGGAFRQARDEIKGKPEFERSLEIMAASMARTAIKVEGLGNAAAGADARLGGGAVPANDNTAATAAKALEAEIAVLANRTMQTPQSALGGIFGRVGVTLLGEEIGTKIGDFLKEYGDGLYLGQIGGGLIGATGTGGQVLSSIGGALGEKFGSQLAESAFGKSLGKLGEQLGPLGAIAGGLLGGVVGKLLTSPKTGSANIAGGAGGLSIASFSGNSKAMRDAAGKGGDSVISSAERIAELLGGSLTGAGSVSIGLRDGKYRVDTTGQGRTKTKKGAVDFGEDAEAAVRFATLDLIKDGIISGLRASTNRILQQGKDLEAAIEKAVDFESVFTRLKEYKDPVGAALDTLDREFVRLQKIFKEAGASTEEYAQLEELYGLERTKSIKEAGERVTASLKGLFDELTVGNDARSLRTRLGLAQAQYDPLAARVRAGDTAAYDGFAEAARQLLDIQRQFSGSQSGYFQLLDEVTALTKSRIDAETNVASISANRDSPFDSRGSATGATGDNAAVVGAIERQTADLTQNLLRGFAQIMDGRIVATSGGDGNFRFASFV